MVRRWEPFVLLGSCLVLLAACGLVVGVSLLGWLLVGPPDVLSRLPGRAVAVNRLVVQGEDHNIYVVRPDGSGRVALTDDASSVRRYRQPVWSPKGDFIAWAEVSPGGGGMSGALIVSRPDGQDRLRVETASPPFYIAWSPDARRLVFLRSRGPRLALDLVDLTARRPEAKELDGGRSYYLDWSPDSRRLLAHVDRDELSLVEMDGQKTALDVQLGRFPAPQWTPDGKAVIYAARVDGQQRLIVADLAGNVRQTVASVEGQVSFVLSPDGRRLAYAISPEGVRAAAFGSLHVADLDTGETQEISDGPVLAFFWSPNSQRLLFVQLDASLPSFPDSLVARHDRIWFRWRVWDGKRTRSLSRFVPTETFLGSYLLFFDQYARSMTLWSPDSRAFVYAGVRSNGQSGIWVESVEEEGSPSFVMPGVLAAWSPR